MHCKAHTDEEDDEKEMFLRFDECTRNNVSKTKMYSVNLSNTRYAGYHPLGCTFIDDKDRRLCSTDVIGTSVSISRLLFLTDFSDVLLPNVKNDIVLLHLLSSRVAYQRFFAPFYPEANLKVAAYGPLAELGLLKRR
jgi:hypothetical protein